jgi:hypothetical protein
VNAGAPPQKATEHFTAQVLSTFIPSASQHCLTVKVLPFRLQEQEHTVSILAGTLKPYAYAHANHTARRTQNAYGATTSHNASSETERLPKPAAPLCLPLRLLAAIPYYQHTYRSLHCFTPRKNTREKTKQDRPWRSWSRSAEKLHRAHGAGVWRPFSGINRLYLLPWFPGCMDWDAIPDAPGFVYFCHRVGR